MRLKSVGGNLGKRWSFTLKLVIKKSRYTMANEALLGRAEHESHDTRDTNLRERRARKPWQMMLECVEKECREAMANFTKRSRVITNQIRTTYRKKQEDLETGT